MFILGGDGTFLHYAKEYAFKEKKIIGFRADKRSFFPHFFEKIKSFDRWVFNTIDLIEINGIMMALNEISIFGEPILNSKIYLNGNHLENYSGTALLFSTQLGSTAQNKSSGGAILFPESNVWTMSEIAPKNLKSLRNSLVFPNNYLIKLIIDGNYSSYIDGISVNLEGNLNLRLIKSSSRYCLFENLENYIDKLKNIFL